MAAKMAGSSATAKAALIAKGKEKYKAGIERIGVDKYFGCGALGGMNVAICLKEAKAKAASSDIWADAWETAMAV